MRLLVVFVIALVAASAAAVVVESSGTSSVALGQAQTFGQWRVSVASIHTTGRGAPPSASNVTIDVSIRYLGVGDAKPPFFGYVEGSHKVRYGDEFGAIQPVGDGRVMFSGARESFTLDFTVADNDLSSLSLYVEPALRPKEATVQFALRPS